MGKDLNISVVLYNSSVAEISNLVKALKENTYVSEVYLIDNSPIRNNAFEISNANYIFSGNNLGYGAGHNIAIQKTIDDGIKYHLVLNPDILIEPIVLDSLLEQMENNEDIGLIMPKIKYPDGQTQYLCKLLATPIDLIGRRFIPLKKWNTERNNKYELRFTGYNKPMQVPSLSGCFMLLRTDVLEKIGGFDERFFMYCEDFDLCRRIGQISKTIYFPEVSVIHNYEKGSYKNRKLLFYHIASAIKYFNKWGWMLDRERKKINKTTLLNLGYKY
tara:strand:+ start:24054 stop:24875 length:822 start_codon:yes stop_codon:yes gene_type:complete